MPLLLVVLIPFSVHAGVLTSLVSIFGEEAVAADPIVVSTPSAADVKLLSAHNNPDPSSALGGGDIIVDDGALLPGGPFGPDDVESKDASGEISVYVVREGDSLSEIAEMFDVTTNTILWANDISNPKNVQPGDTLIILPIVGVRHVVKSGDTIASVAKKYEADADEIRSYNRLASDSLTVGATLIIPGGNMHTAAPKTTTKVAASASGSTRSSAGGGYFTHPLPGAVRTQGIHGYNAVDLAAPVGTPIRAAAAGEVIVSKSSGWNGGYGNYVVIKHPNGTQTLYAHTSSNVVGVGAYVAAGETIAYVGMTGKSTGAHLHFEVRGASNPF
ncbi:M23 family metallopeptidase [Candidatus Kaiserbacteria bacterium]|nr:M23 family metallopeptidase [Candidatus Kaiserbacteria bacterium]